MEPYQQTPTPVAPTLDAGAKRLTERVLIAALVAAALFALFSFFTKDNTPAAAMQAVSAREYADIFEGLTLEADAVLIWDARDGRAIYGRDARRVLPLASITKLMTAIAAQSALPSDTIITISARALATDGGNGLFIGERWKRDALISYMLITSSNDAAAALAESYAYARPESSKDFVTVMNERADTLDLTDTVFVNPTGLDEGAGEPVNRGSTYDVAKLFAEVAMTMPELLDATRFAEAGIASESSVHDVKNTNLIANSVPLSIGSKTGFTDSAGGNLVLSFDIGIGHPVIIVVLGSSREGRFTDMTKLIEATRTYFDELSRVTVETSA